MRVLQVTRDFPPRINGGLSTAVGGMVAAADDAGIEQAVLSFDDYRPSRRPSDAEEPILDGRVMRLSAPSQLPAAEAFARRFAPEVVHVHHAMLWDFAIAIEARRIFSVHVVQRWAREARGLPQATQSEQAQARALAEADLVTVPSEACRPLVATARPVALVPLAVDDGALAREAVERERPRGQVLFAGRLSDVKGARELLEAAPRLQRAGITLRLAAGLPDNPKAERRWRRRFAEAAPEATWLGWQPPEALPELYATSTLLLAPSWFETFGLAAAEAMLHGTPVVGSEVGGLAALIEHGRTGWLVPPRDVDALVATVVEAVAAPGDRGRAAAAAIRQAHTYAQGGLPRRALLAAYAGSELALDPADGTTG